MVKMKGEKQQTLSLPSTWVRYRALDTSFHSASYDCATTCGGMAPWSIRSTICAGSASHIPPINAARTKKRCMPSNLKRLAVGSGCLMRHNSLRLIAKGGLSRVLECPVRLKQVHENIFISTAIHRCDACQAGLWQPTEDRVHACM